VQELREGFTTYAGWRKLDRNFFGVGTLVEHGDRQLRTAVSSLWLGVTTAPSFTYLFVCLVEFMSEEITMLNKQVLIPSIDGIYLGCVVIVRSEAETSLSRTQPPTLNLWPLG